MTMIEKTQQNKAPRWILYLKALAMRVAAITRRICQRVHQRLAPPKTVAASETVAKKEMRAVEAPARSRHTWEEVMTSAIHFIKDSYELRFNLLDARPELRAKHETDLTRESLLAKDFCPATPTIINTIVVDLHAHGIRVWDRDVKRLLYLPLFRNTIVRLTF